MDSCFGICGKDFVIVCADTSVNRSIFNLKSTEDKITQINDFKVMASSGEACERDGFSSYISANIKLQEFRTGHGMSVDSTAEFTRTELAKGLRKAPFQVNILLAGYDNLDNTPKLYWMDYLGTLARVTRGAHGYAGYFVNSVLDNQY